MADTSNDEKNDEIQIHDIPGGPAAFEICAKFCYGMTVTLNAYNVVAARCAAEYLEMYETIDKSNLVYKIEVFLNTSIFRSWKDSIIVFQTTKSLLPWAEELKVVSHCLESIASKVAVDTSKVEWSYTYNRKKLPSENGTDRQWNGVRKQSQVPQDWWVEDLCDLQIDLYKRVITTIKTKAKTPSNVIGESLKAYAMRRLQTGDVIKTRSLVETVIGLLPNERKSVSCSFLFKLLQVSILLECGEMGTEELKRRISEQLEEAKVGDLLIQAQPKDTAMYNTRIVQELVEEFLSAKSDCTLENVSEKSKMKVAKLLDGYLAEVAKDPNLPLSKFVQLAEMVLSFSIPSHDGLYRAIDMYLKVNYFFPPFLANILVITDELEFDQFRLCLNGFCGKELNSLDCFT